MSSSQKATEYVSKIFRNKYLQYGFAYCELSNNSLIEFIIAKAIATKTLIQNDKIKKAKSECAAVVNYSILFIIGYAPHIYQKHQKILHNIEKLIDKKNELYGNHWAHMKMLTLIEIILMKLKRIQMISEKHPNDPNHEYNIRTDQRWNEIHDIIAYGLFLISKLLYEEKET